MSRSPKLAARAAIAVLRFYQVVISPCFPPRCRFSPTCSAYAVEAITRFGLVRGLWLALRRLSRCHPWHRGGHDPVPVRVDSRVGAVASSGGPAGQLRSTSC